MNVHGVNALRCRLLFLSVNARFDYSTRTSILMQHRTDSWPNLKRLSNKLAARLYRQLFSETSTLCLIQNAKTHDGTLSRRDTFRHSLQEQQPGEEQESAFTQIGFSPKN